MSNQPISQESIQLNQSALIEFFVLDASAIGGEIYRFHNGTDTLGGNVMWQGLEYVQHPLKAEGFEIKSQGVLPRPNIAFANVLGTFSALCLAYGDLLGAKITRKRTFEKFLDGRPNADPTAFFPDDIYFIDRKSAETKHQITFELASPMDVDDVTLPRRKIVANLCPWIYRSAECSFVFDTVIADKEDVIIPASPRTARGAYSIANTYVEGDYTYILQNGIKRYFYCKDDNGGGITGSAYSPPNVLYWTADQCAKRVHSCRLRFAQRPGGLPHGGFIGVANLPL